MSAFRGLILLGIVTALSLAAGMGLSPRQVLLRGPYLQSATPSSIVVRWRTAVAVPSRVFFIDAGGGPARVVERPDAVTEHEVLLPGLAPGTRYLYSIGAASDGSQQGYRFTSAPAPGSAQATRVWVLGDPGTGDANAAAVRDGFKKFSEAKAANLILTLGDNAYGKGLDSEYQKSVFDIYGALLREVPFWPAYGNHDGYSADAAAGIGPYFRNFTLPSQGEAGGLPSGSEAYYAFDYANIHFVSLDSAQSSRAADGVMARWLAADLAASRQDWIVAYWHHPPHSKGSHDSDAEIELIEMRENILPILEARGVDLVLTGHSHSYERSALIAGHYGGAASFAVAHVIAGGDGDPAGDGAYRKPRLRSANAGTVYVVMGSSGVARAAPLDHPAMRVSLHSLGSIILDVEGQTLEVRFIDEKGVVQDRFAIRKDAAD